MVGGTAPAGGKVVDRALEARCRGGQAIDLVHLVREICTCPGRRRVPRAARRRIRVLLATGVDVGEQLADR